MPTLYQTPPSPATAICRMSNYDPSTRYEQKDTLRLEAVYQSLDILIDCGAVQHASCPLNRFNITTRDGLRQPGTSRLCRKASSVPLLRLPALPFNKELVGRGTVHVHSEAVHVHVLEDANGTRPRETGCRPDRARKQGSRRGRRVRVRERERGGLAFCRYDVESSPLKLVPKKKLPRSPNRSDAYKGI